MNIFHTTFRSAGSRWLVCLLLLGWSWFSLAAEGDTDAAAATATSATADNKAKGDPSADQDSTPATTAKPRENNSVFVPSEAISEDFAVSFPADI